MQQRNPTKCPVEEANCRVDGTQPMFAPRHEVRKLVDFVALHFARQGAGVNT